MKITLIREDRESGKETLSTCEADAWIDRIKTETKEEHVTRLRSMLLYTNPDSGGYYEHIDKLPRIYPSVEFGRSRDNGRKLKERCLLMTAKRFSMLPRNLVFVTASA